MGTAETYLVVNLSGMFYVFDIEVNVLTKGNMTLIRKLDTSPVGQLQMETIGLPGLSGLRILGKKYITGVLGVVVNRLEQRQANRRLK